MSSFGEAVKQRALRVRPTPAVEKHISKAFGHYLRIQILWILNERVACATEMAEELSAPLNRISGHIKVLREADCIEVVDQVVVGNTVQKFYGPPPESSSMTRNGGPFHLPSKRV